MSELARLKGELDRLDLPNIPAFTNKYDTNFLLSLAGTPDNMQLTNCSGTADFLLKLYLSNDFFNGRAEKIYHSAEDGQRIANVVQTNSDNAKALRADDNLSVKALKPIIFSPDCHSEIVKLTACGASNHWITVVRNEQKFAVLQGWDNRFSLFSKLNDPGEQYIFLFEGANAEAEMHVFITGGREMSTSSLALLRRKESVKPVNGNTPASSSWFSSALASCFSCCSSLSPSPSSSSASAFPQPSASPHLSAAVRAAAGGAKVPSATDASSSSSVAAPNNSGMSEIAPASLGAMNRETDVPPKVKVKMPISWTIFARYQKVLDGAPRRGV